MTAVWPCPGLAVHSGAKGFEHLFADALTYELKDKIDVLSLMPAAVNSTRLKDAPSNFYTCTP